MFEAILQITIYLTMVLSPVLVPGAVHIVNVIANRRRARVEAHPAPAAQLPQVPAPRPVPVPAAA